MMRAIVSRIIPRAMASSSSPFDVSSEIAVVMTRVNPLILPPTMRAKPTSEMALPKAIITAAKTAYLASLNMMRAVCQPLAPRERAVSASALSTPLRAEIVKPSSIGVIRITCPITMTVGVKSKLSPPSGPALEKSTKTKRPITTVGTLNKV